MIVKQVNCLSCHIYEFEDLKEGRHIKMMNYTQNRFLYDYLDLYGDNSTGGSCYSCHLIYANYYQFGLTDPYSYIIGKKTYTLNNQTSTVNLTDAQYGYIISWPAGNRSIVNFDNYSASLHIELEILDISPENFTVDPATIKVILANYSGQQSGNPVLDSSAVLSKGDTMVVDITNFSEDYFKIILIFDGLWNTTLANLRVNDTDKGNESFFIIANNHPFVYDLPLDANGIYYFKTNGTYKAVRLDYVMGEWVNYTMENITTSEIINTSVGSGKINASTCSSPDAMCHINQKTTHMGLSNSMNPDRSFYTHQMKFTTSAQCEICHLNNKILVEEKR